MIIYLDAEYKCHVTNDGTMTEHDVPFFDDKCKAVIEGYRYVPSGETWVRSDGVEFQGEMVAPFVDSRILAAYQAQYEADLAEQKDMEAALNTLGVTVDG